MKDDEEGNDQSHAQRRRERLHDAMIDGGDQSDGRADQQQRPPIIDAAVGNRYRRRDIALGTIDQRQNHGAHGDGNEKEKDRAPVNIIDDQAADARADQHAGMKSGCHETLRLAGGFLGHRFERQRPPLGLGHRRADALKHAKDD